MAAAFVRSAKRARQRLVRASNAIHARLESLPQGAVASALHAMQASMQKLAAQIALAVLQGHFLELQARIVRPARSASIRANRAKILASSALARASSQTATQHAKRVLVFGYPHKTNASAFASQRRWRKAMNASLATRA